MSVNTPSSTINLSTQDSTRLNAGRGTGEGTAYTPWIKVHEISSKGQKHLIRGYTVAREYHLLSRGEAACFRIFDWHSNVIDIREQYPLLPLQATLDLAKTWAIPHPNMTRQKDMAHVLTLDFLLTVQHDGQDELRAVSYKPASNLSHSTTLKRLELERRYFETHGVNGKAVSWRIVTEESISHVLVANLEHLAPEVFIDLLDATFDQCMLNLERAWSATRTLTAIAALADKATGCQPGTCLSVARQLIYEQTWKVNLQQPFKVSNSIIRLDAGQPRVLKRRLR